MDGRGRAGRSERQEVALLGVRRLLKLAETELGPPPCSYAWLVFGSEGRMEQALLTDQDNALCYEEDMPGAKGTTDSYRRELDLGAMLRSGDSREKLERAVAEAIKHKAAGHGKMDNDTGAAGVCASMAAIGG